MKKILLFLLLLPVSLFAQNQGGVIIVGGVAVHQPDTSAYKVINTIQSDGTALNGNNRFYVTYLVALSKKDSLWQKSKAFYGFIGGTSASHKWNWKDMRDLDVAFRLTFTGGVTHSYLGAKGDGSTGYAETFLIPYNVLTLNSTHMSIYSTGSFNNTTGIDLRAVSSASNDMILNLSRTDGSTVSAMYDQFSGSIITSTPNISKYIIGNRKSSSSHKIYRDGKEIASSTTNGGSLPSTEFYVFASKPVTAPVERFSTIRIGYLSIGLGLTDQQAIQASNTVTFAQGILGRK